MNDLTRRLRETKAWYTLKRPLAKPERAPSSWKRRDELQIDEWAAVENLLPTVQSIVIRRHELLAEEEALRLDGPEAQGRVLVLEIDKNLEDGAAYLATGGFIGKLNLPPCDLWVDALPYFELATGQREPLLLSWIPVEHVPLVQCGINVNAEGSLKWADEYGPRLLERVGM
ncbi:MAG: hypothetical protein U0271_33515 [Polyangiaceae bacterium]